MTQKKWAQLIKFITFRLYLKYVLSHVCARACVLGGGLYLCITRITGACTSDAISMRNMYFHNQTQVAVPQLNSFF
jgi:hypothetical protein